MSDIVLFGDSLITHFAEFLESDDKYNNLGLDKMRVSSKLDALD